jgi:hypothetical protein
MSLIVRKTLSALVTYEPHWYLTDTIGSATILLARATPDH